MPSSISAGSGTFILSISGGSFVPGAQAFFRGTALGTTYQSATALEASVPGFLVERSGIVEVLVVNPAPGGGASAPVAFSVDDPANVDAGTPTPHKGILTWGGAKNYTGSYGGTLDSYGNTYVVGFFTEPVDFDPGPGVHMVTVTPSSNPQDGYVLKLD